MSVSNTSPMALKHNQGGVIKWRPAVLSNLTLIKSTACLIPVTCAYDLYSITTPTRVQIAHCRVVILPFQYGKTKPVRRRNTTYILYYPKLYVTCVALLRYELFWFGLIYLISTYTLAISPKWSNRHNFHDANFTRTVIIVPDENCEGNLIPATMKLFN